MLILRKRHNLQINVELVNLEFRVLFTFPSIVVLDSETLLCDTSKIQPPRATLWLIHVYLRHNNLRILDSKVHWQIVNLEAAEQLEAFYLTPDEDSDEIPILSLMRATVCVVCDSDSASHCLTFTPSNTRYCCQIVASGSGGYFHADGN